MAHLKGGLSGSFYFIVSLVPAVAFYDFRLLSGDISGRSTAYGKVHTIIYVSPSAPTRLGSVILFRKNTECSNRPHAQLPNGEGARRVGNFHC